MPMTITFSDDEPLVLDEYSGPLEDIHPEYSVEVSDDPEVPPSFEFTTSPLW